MDFFNNIYSVLLRPSASFSRLAKEYNIGLMMQGILAFLLASSIQNNLSIRAIADSVLVLAILVAMIFLLGFVFKLKGDDFFKLTCLISFANLPIIFTSPIKLLADFHAGLSNWLQIGVSIWVFCLYVLAISKACDISKRRVLLFFSIPIIGIMMLITSSILQILLAF